MKSLWNEITKRKSWRLNWSSVKQKHQTFLVVVPAFDICGWLLVDSARNTADKTRVRLSFFFFLLYFIFFPFILIYNTVLVLPYIDMNPPRVYMRSQTWTPTHLPPHNVSLGHHRAPAPSMLYPASDIDWRFVSYMIVYMFQCHSPKSSHPLPLPLSPKVCSTHLCLFCCLAYRVIIAIFLNSIYMC